MSRGMTVLAIGGRLLLSLYLAIALAGCAVQFVSAYDEVFDRSANEAQQNLALLLTELQDPASPSRTYRNSAPPFAEIAADLHALRVRAEANNEGGRNAETITIVDTIQENVALRQERHRPNPGGPPAAFVQSAQGLLDLQFRSLIAFEFTKKRRL